MRIVSAATTPHGPAPIMACWVVLCIAFCEEAFFVSVFVASFGTTGSFSSELADDSVVTASLLLSSSTLLILLAVGLTLATLAFDCSVLCA